MILGLLSPTATLSPLLPLCLSVILALGSTRALTEEEAQSFGMGDVEEYDRSFGSSQSLGMGIAEEDEWQSFGMGDSQSFGMGKEEEDFQSFGMGNSENEETQSFGMGDSPNFSLGKEVHF